MNAMLSKKRAIAATVIFVAVGIMGSVLFITDWRTGWPLVLFYIALVANNYFSIRYFSDIVPPHASWQMPIDTALVALCIILTLTLGNPLYFMLATTILFSVATLKYASALHTIVAPERLHRKIKIDAMGAAGSSLALAGVILGQAFAATAVWAIVFFAVSIYVILMEPLYGEVHLAAGIGSHNNRK
jgi:hypothetical protein